jgi:hypothetical protein
LTATAESKQLLSHAGMLLTAARAAGSADRSMLVTEAKADLTHVARLLPLAPPRDQPGLRTELQRLNRQVPPMAAPAARHDDAARHRADATSSGTRYGEGAGATAGGRNAPVADQPPRQRQSTRDSSTPPTGGAANRPPTAQPSGTQQGTEPPPSGTPYGADAGPGGQRPPPGR